MLWLLLSSKKKKKKPVGNSESEGILSDNCLSVWATVWWWQWWWEIQDSGWWWWGDQRSWGGKCRRLTDAPHLPLPHPERGVREEPESVKKPKGYIPLENQESMFIKRNKNLGEKKSGEKCKSQSCTLVVLKIKTVQCPGAWLASPHPLCHHFSKLSLLSPKNVLFEPKACFSLAHDPLKFPPALQPSGGGGGAEQMEGGSPGPPERGLVAAWLPAS